ncbi:hypothetical protein BJ165DRAFT_1492250 [Panaeolus papilionaceus]|nr:hypothetical protein BJ165DRAFT_1492250 [Panaeolus papilionaceus]
MSDKHKIPAEERVSAKFNDLNAEIRFISSDRVVFHIYKDHLKSTSEILQVPDYTTVDSESTRVPLTERSEVLELLFQFVHPPSDDQQGRQPDLGTITDTNLFFDLAEAGEKYGVYALKTACIPRMEVKLSKSENSIKILNHCLLHDYYDRLVDQAGLQTLSISLEDVATGLSRLEDLQHWLCYYKLYVDFKKSVTDQLYSLICRHPECHDLKAFYTEYNERAHFLVNAAYIAPSAPVTHTRCAYGFNAECRTFQQTLQTFVNSQSSSLVSLTQVIKTRSKQQ